MNRAERAAAVARPDQLAEHLRVPAARLLAEVGKRLKARGHGPDQVARSVRHLLLKIAFYEIVPETVEEAMGRWPWRTDIEMLAALRGHGPDTFGRAMELIEKKEDAPRSKRGRYKANDTVVEDK